PSAKILVESQSVGTSARYRRSQIRMPAPSRLHRWSLSCPTTTETLSSLRCCEKHKRNTLLRKSGDSCRTVEGCRVDNIAFRVSHSSNNAVLTNGTCDDQIVLARRNRDHRATSGSRADRKRQGHSPR